LLLLFFDCRLQCRCSSSLGDDHYGEDLLDLTHNRKREKTVGRKRRLEAWLADAIYIWLLLFLQFVSRLEASPLSPIIWTVPPSPPYHHFT